MADVKPSRAKAHRAARRIALLAIAGLLAACGIVAGIDGLEVGECKGGNCAPETGVAEIQIDPPAETGPPVEGGLMFDGAGLPCTSAKGPAMVRVGTTTNNFCIDSTEVTVGQYKAFTDAKGNDASGQPPECAWNTSYAAGAGGADDNLPIAGIDWCDARAYCQFAGKRLCGKHKDGKFVGPVAQDELADFAVHEWLLACSAAGQLRYPYGGIQVPTACNTGENDAGRTVVVKSKTGCQGGFPGVYDMVGNLWEWFDGPCPPPDGGLDAGPEKAGCLLKGGSYAVTGMNLGCSTNGLGATRDTRSTEVGFRCCSD